MITKTRKSTLRFFANRLKDYIFAGQPIDPVEWAESKFHLPRESSSEIGVFRAIGYQRGIISLFCDDRIKKVVHKKSARTGGTKILIITTCYYSSEKRRLILCYFPDDKKVGLFDKKEFEPCAIASGLDKNFLDFGKPNSKQYSKSFKKFVGGSLTLLSGGNDKEFAAHSADIVMGSEVRDWTSDAKTQGDKVKLMTTRCQNSPYPMVRMESSPLRFESDIISLEFDQCDLKLFYFVECPFCGEWQQIEFDRIHIYDEINAGLECVGCSEYIDYTYQHGLVENGRWMNEKKTIEYLYSPSRFIDLETNEEISKSRFKSVGMFIWCGYAPFPQVAWANLVDEYKKIGDDYAKRMAFKTTTLGESWTEDAKETPDWEEIKKNQRVFSIQQIPDYVKFVTAGVDTQENRFEVSIVGWGVEGGLITPYVLDHIVIEGNPELEETRDALDSFINAYYNYDGDTKKINTTCVDMFGLSADIMKSYIIGHRYTEETKILGIKGSSTIGAPIWDFVERTWRQKIKKDQAVGGWMIGSNLARVWLVMSLLKKRIYFRKGLPDEYFKQLGKFGIRKTYKPSGQQELRGIKPKKGGEAGDCLIYAYAAFLSMKKTIKDFEEPKKPTKKIKIKY